MKAIIGVCLAFSVAMVSHRCEGKEKPDSQVLKVLQGGWIKVCDCNINLLGPKPDTTDRICYDYRRVSFAEVATKLAYARLEGVDSLLRQIVAYDYNRPETTYYSFDGIRIPDPPGFIRDEFYSDESKAKMLRAEERGPFIGDTTWTRAHRVKSIRFGKTTVEFERNGKVAKIRDSWNAGSYSDNLTEYIHVGDTISGREIIKEYDYDREHDHRSLHLRCLIDFGSRKEQYTLYSPFGTLSDIFTDWYDDRGELLREHNDFSGVTGIRYRSVDGSVDAWKTYNYRKLVSVRESVYRR
jgi:hypothetical protein